MKAAACLDDGVDIWLHKIWGTAKKKERGSRRKPPKSGTATIKLDAVTSDWGEPSRSDGKWLWTSREGRRG